MTLAESIQFDAIEVTAHKDFENGIWVIYKDRVYDVTKFLDDHPGGSDIIKQYAGEDISELIQEESIHVHSKAALEILETLYIGNVKKTSTDSENLLHKEQECFIDLTKPLVYQFWNTRLTKEEYLKNVHKPRYLKEPATFFESPLLEPLSRTPWYVIPLFWIPIIISMEIYAYESLGFPQCLQLGIIGLLSWFFIEYTLHRFIFHIEMGLPDNKVAFLAHFLLHGVHHLLPMDKFRLVFPPVLGLPIALILYGAINTFLSMSQTFGIAAGVVTGYMYYDLTHYYLHHGVPKSNYMKGLKKYHMDHHYVNYNLGFGVSNKLVDYIFGTMLPQ
ncbi:Cytochrome b5-like heme/steroid binding domain-containing protein [Rozella allomycis CSF55]|uniref:Ceramide very long chain fatty acid hydroxylase n=2 Tax=Rozella allomycis (strain CSF55) TaxID=988480 RepID=A0A075AXW5_ROZAC|nr:Cytochrome b5-like heme/steroid binding domain-containing protein [Rozella allomycis CSF55]|eukprot:EPZ33414.1 Cytochrome b5-like heme/steroid binding domain-containing protein [Rozella allomycis CSF55]